MMKGFRQRVHEQLFHFKADQRSSPERNQSHRIDDTEVSSTVRLANAELKRFIDADYRLSADIQQNSLNIHQKRLQTMLDGFSLLNEIQLISLLQCLSVLQEELGDYDKAEKAYETLFPHLKLGPREVIGLREFLPDKAEIHWVEALQNYISFLVRTSRKLDFAEAVIRVLPWTQSIDLRSDPVRWKTLFDTIHILTAQSNFLEASKYMMVLRGFPTVKMEVPRLGRIKLQSAIIEAGQGRQSGVQDDFIKSYVLLSVWKGLWHIHTLNTLYYFGKSLRDWNRHQEAIVILEECCLGLIYRFGVTHPRSNRALEVLESCTASQSCLQALQRSGRANYPQGKRLSMAYERNHLDTCVDLLHRAGIHDVDYHGLADHLEQLLDSKTLPNIRFDALRTILRCTFELGDTTRALDMLKELYREIKPHDTQRYLVWLDHIMYNAGSESPSGNDTILPLERNEGSKEEEAAYWIPQATPDGRLFYYFNTLTGVSTMELPLESPAANESGPRDRVRMSKFILIGTEGELPPPKHQVKAIQRKLAATGFTHFTREILASDPPLILEQESKTLGTGAYAVVDSINIGTRLFARKSVALPRYNQKSVRTIIQNEISVIRRLNHPHIVRVYLTYEDKSRFYIVMKPLADCDLEAFLEEHTRNPPRADQRAMVWKWLLCLSNTLAFIHSRGIRHKDIKPRNVLIKGEKVIFADFGSSHAFLDEGNSTTEGPAFGHTKMYSAPEVIANGKRGRSADIFSLGCVFIELAVWLAGWTIADWIKRRETVVDGDTTIAYSATMKNVMQHLGRRPQSSEVLALYVNVIHHMMRKDPGNRRTAIQTSDLVLSTYKQIFRYSEAMQKCSKCDLELWVDNVDAGSKSVQSFDAGNQK